MMPTLSSHQGCCVGSVKISKISLRTGGAKNMAHPQHSSRLLCVEFKEACTVIKVAVCAASKEACTVIKVAVCGV